MKKQVLLLALLKIQGFGPAKVLKILERYNFNYEKIINNIEEYVDINIFQSLLRQSENEIRANLEKGIKLITIFDDNFPERLYAINDPVLYLYYKGDISLINQKNIAIIGTRKATIKGINDAILAGQIFASKNIVVTSGLAIGIDTAGHMGTLKVSGKTIAVLPTDLENIHPKSNIKLSEEILKANGCLVSEYPVGSKINKYCFVKRDRIQSALSHAILVIEATEKSGTMNAVKTALKSNKPVFQLLTNNIPQITQKIDLNNESDVIKVLNEIDKIANMQKKKYDQLQFLVD